MRKRINSPLPLTSFLSLHANMTQVLANITEQPRNPPTPTHFQLWKSSGSYKHAVLVVLGLPPLTPALHPVQLSSQARMLLEMPVWLCWADHGGEQKEHLGANPSLPSLLHMGCQLHWGGALHIPSNCSTVLWGLCYLQSPGPAPWELVGLQASTALMEPVAFLGRLVFAASLQIWLLLQQEQKLMNNVQ